MSYQELSDREKLDIIEKHWYREAQDFVNAPDAIAREEALSRCDILLDAYLEFVADLGSFAVQEAT